MRPEALAEVLRGLEGPVVVCLQAGNVNSGAFDPFAALIPAARAASAWVHVDGAFGLWAAACPELRRLTSGMEDADSWAADGHKWLQVPYDCGLAVVRDVAAMQRAMSITAAYLPTSEHRQPESFSPEMSRRARGFAVWAVIKAMGRDGIAAMVARHCAVARAIAAGVTRVPGLEVLNAVALNQVVVTTDAGDAATRALLARVQADGLCYPSAGVWRGRAILRVSVSAGPAELAHADVTGAAIADAGGAVRGAGVAAGLRPRAAVAE
jgi:glutamate/tyrosine decarboxylase-like PLP-dependent enzyme